MFSKYMKFRGKKILNVFVVVAAMTFIAWNFFRLFLGISNAKSTTNALKHKQKQMTFVLASPSHLSGSQHTKIILLSHERYFMQRNTDLPTDRCQRFIIIFPQN